MHHTRMLPHRRRFLDKLVARAQAAKAAQDDESLVEACRHAWQTGGGRWLMVIARATRTSLVRITDLAGAPQPPQKGMTPQGRAVPGGVKRSRAILAHQEALRATEGRVKSTWHVDGKSKEGRRVVRDICERHR